MLAKRTTLCETTESTKVAGDVLFLTRPADYITRVVSGRETRIDLSILFIRNGKKESGSIGCFDDTHCFSRAPVTRRKTVMRRKSCVRDKAVRLRGS